MPERYMSIWFRYLETDWFTRRHPALGQQPFVLYETQRGRQVVTAVNQLAERQGIRVGIPLADARAVIPSLQVKEDNPAFFEKQLHKMAEWFIRFSPEVAVDPPAGILMNCTGCAHLWGGEQGYLRQIVHRLRSLGYTVHTAMAGTIGTAWAHCHYGEPHGIIQHTQEAAALALLPTLALRIDSETAECLYKLGLTDIGQILSLPTPALRRRFGEALIRQLQYALGYRKEHMKTVRETVTYSERLPCLEPIVTAKGIEIALYELVDRLCQKLKEGGKGLRQSSFSACRVDGKTEQISISLHKPSDNAAHLFHLFAEKIQQLAPEPGIELFMIEARRVEPNPPAQEKIWTTTTRSLTGKPVTELVDRLVNKIGEQYVHRYLPAEHYWPERSFKKEKDLQAEPLSDWKLSDPRPLRILPQPEPVMVTAPVPDYPPLLFIYKGKRHKIVKADGPERIEQEWWLQQGMHRDYYYVEDEAGNRYWLFRLGHYDAGKKDQWFLHGYDA